MLETRKKRCYNGMQDFMYESYPHLNQLLKCLPQEYPRERPSLEPLKSFLNKIGDPQKKFASILIGGTNGKGSVLTFLERTLLNSGLNVAAYTSPHIKCFSERFRVLGKEASLEELEAILSSWDQESLKTLSFFEICTALAFEWFNRKSVSLAVLEVGLGGRFDASNCVDPLISLIVSLDYDHQDLLGNSLTDIAYEKIGIFRSPGKNLLGPQGPEKKAVFRELLLVEAMEFQELNSLALDFLNEGEWTQVQWNNIKSAWGIILELRKMGHCIPVENFVAAISQTIPGRLELRNGVLFDVAHNEDAFKHQIAYLEKFFPDRDYIYLLSLSKNKNIDAILALIQGKAKHLIICETTHPRTLKINEWKLMFPDLSADYFNDPKEAFQKLSEYKSKASLPIVTGSFFLMAEL